MKKCNPFFCFLLLIICSQPAIAQQVQQPVRFLKGGFVTGNNISNPNFSANDLRASLFGDRYFVLVQFTILPSPSTKAALKNAGVELGDYIPGNAFLATIKNDLLFSSLQQYDISSVNTIPGFYKTAGRLATYQSANTKEGEELFAVNYFSTINRAAVCRELQKAGAVIVPTKYDAANIVFIQPDK